MSHDLGRVTIFRVRIRVWIRERVRIRVMIKIRVRLGVRVRIRVRIWVKFKIQKNTKLQSLKIVTLHKT
jgi:hypothetical protein